MANPYFQFKQFTVHHDRCAMKVGTDGVLLGAWTPLFCKPNLKVLDIGTGTGLVALMLAQRLESLKDKDCLKSEFLEIPNDAIKSGFDFSVDALEIDNDAAAQAGENIDKSPWCLSIRVLNKDFKVWSGKRDINGVKYDIIVSNPPYFQNSLKNSKKQKTQARHTDDLSFQELLAGVKKLLSPQGACVIILPTSEMEILEMLAKDVGLIPQRKLLVCTKPNGPVRRVLTQFVHESAFCYEAYKEDALLTEVARHQYSNEFKALTRDFYLNKE